MKVTLQNEKGNIIGRENCKIKTYIIEWNKMITMKDIKMFMI